MLNKTDNQNENKLDYENKLNNKIDVNNENKEINLDCINNNDIFYMQMMNFE